MRGEREVGEGDSGSGSEKIKATSVQRWPSLMFNKMPEHGKIIPPFP